MSPAADTATLEAEGRFRDGWTNICERCHRPYWVRVADMGRDHMRRFAGRETNELHVCPPLGASS